MNPFDRYRQTVTETPEEQTAKIVFQSLQGASIRQSLETIETLSYEVGMALLELAQKDMEKNLYTPEAAFKLSLYHAIKYHFYPETMRRKWAADPVLNRDEPKIPVPAFTNSRRIEAAASAENLSERGIEIMMERATKRYDFDFQTRLEMELQAREIPAKLARFMAMDWNVADAPELEAQWGSCVWRSKVHSNQDYWDYQKELEKGEMQKAEELFELGEFSPAQIQDSLKALFPNADELAYSVNGIKTPHLVHLSLNEHGYCFFSVGNAGHKLGDTTARVGFQIPNFVEGESFQVSLPIEQLCNLSQGKKNVTVKAQKGVIDIEAELEETSLKEAKKRQREANKKAKTKPVLNWVAWEGHFVSLAIDFKHAVLVIRGKGWESRVKMITAEKRRDCVTCSANGFYFNDNNPTQHCEDCKGRGYLVTAKG